MTRHTFLATFVAVVGGAGLASCVSCPDRVPRCDGAVAHMCVDALNKKGEVDGKRAEVLNCAAESLVCIVAEEQARCVLPSKERCHMSGSRCSQDGRRVERCDDGGYWTATGGCADAEICVQHGAYAICAVDPPKTYDPALFTERCDGDRRVFCGDAGGTRYVSTAPCTGCTPAGGKVHCSP